MKTFYRQLAGAVPVAAARLSVEGAARVEGRPWHYEQLWKDSTAPSQRDRGQDELPSLSFFMFPCLAQAQEIIIPSNIPLKRM